jgi:rhodanese-related sulfurtransferase
VAVSNASADYAGDLSAGEAWSLLENNPKTQLVDVRTTAEWSFVGLPDLSGAGRKVHTIEWQTFPSMAVNPDFTAATADALAKAGADKDTPILFLCRSGARSRSAAMALTRAGFTRAFNIAGGFEGDVGPDGHRGHVNGWKAANLPWRQN